MADRRDFFESLVYQSVGRRRFTQQSPVMPDVWIQYGMRPGQPQQLLMVPNCLFVHGPSQAGVIRLRGTDRLRWRCGDATSHSHCPGGLSPPRLRQAVFGVSNCPDA